MIAAACLSTNLPPEAFGVPSSEALGAVMLSMLAERRKAEHERGLLDRLRRR